MRTLTSLAVASALILTTGFASADGLTAQSQEPPAATNDVWGSEAAKSSSINAGYIVLGVFLALLAAGAINDAND